MMVRKEILLWASIGLACSHPLKSKSATDAADVQPDAAAPTETGAGADIATDASADTATGQLDIVEALPDGLQTEVISVADTHDQRPDLAEAAALLLDGSRAEVADALASETSPWADARWLIDGPCSYNPPDLMQVLAASLESYEVHCTRTAVSDPEGTIDFDGEGRISYITGRRIPADPQGWVESLAAYRWPCLAGQNIGYGCSL